MPLLASTVAACAGLLAASCGSRGQAAPADDHPFVAGPFAGTVALGPDTRRALPPPMDSLAPDATATFYWFDPGAPGHSLTFTIRAESVDALDQGAVIHEQQVDVRPGGAHQQGVVSFRPSRLSRGGARRTQRGRLRWSAGLYSVTATRGASDVGRALFQVSP